MKTNTLKKATIASMAIAMGAAIAGSISGTVAWYQYSTRSTVAYSGASAHCSESIQIRIRSTKTDGFGEWKQDLTSTDIATYLAATTANGGANRTAATNELRPVTSGELAAGAVAATLYKNPIYQYAEMTSWGEASAEVDYIVIPLEIRVKDVTGADTDSYLAKKIYVSDVTLQAATDNPSGKIDVSSALRVGVSAVTAPDSGNPVFADYATFAKSADPVKVYGKLDLNNDGIIDQTEGYDFSTGRADVLYGVNEKTAVATANTKVTSNVVGVADDSTATAIVGKEIGSTSATKNLYVNLKIYLEGWTELSTKTATSGSDTVDVKSIWDETKTVGAKFNVGIRFTAEAHTDAE
ncbi:MAG: hypothetical protein IJU64_06620 [Bacilli bacterium]|nr:hypothetical protein [Bacilli bacterium]